MFSDLPLVSAIMPTLSERAAMRADAIRCFDWQTYPHRELVMVEDAGTIGAKRNMACSRARGEIICAWDDDDLFAPTRIEDQVKRLLESGQPVTGYHSLLFYDVPTRRLVKYTNGNHHYAVGVSLMFTKDHWRAHPFRDLQTGEDNAFVSECGSRIACVDGGKQIIARNHRGNTSIKPINDQYVELPLSELPAWFREFQCV